METGTKVSADSEGVPQSDEEIKSALALTPADLTPGSEASPKYESDSELFRLHPALYQAVFHDRRNVLMTGLAGCGKSYNIGLIKQDAMRMGIKCDVTSTTGVSANAI